MVPTLTKKSFNHCIFTILSSFTYCPIIQRPKANLP